MKYNIDVSIGELVDKISILEIKLEKVTCTDKLKNIRLEFDLLTKNIPEYKHINYYLQLLSINKKLWDVEDRIRVLEASEQFDSEFIELARNVYILNDERAALKKKINIEHGSELIEEKQYVNY